MRAENAIAWRRAWPAAIAAALVFAGCETTTATKPKSSAPLADAGEPDEAAKTTDPTTNAQSRAAQADRDIDTLLQLRSAGKQRSSAATTTGDGTGVPNPRQERRVRWTDGAGAASPPSTTSTTSVPSPAVTRDIPETLDPVTPAAAPTLDELHLKLVNLRRDLYRESIDSTQPIKELLAIAAMSIIEPDLQLPDNAHRDLSPGERELLDELHAFFAQLGRELDDEHEVHTTILDALNELQSALVDEPSLVLPATTLCWRIGGFGDYDVFEPYSFLAHIEQSVILYLEIEGFTSEQNRKGEYVTIIGQQLEIYDRDGVPVWSDPWQKVTDVTQKPRRDFFTTQMIELPKQLSVGRYNLKVRVRDDKSGAEAETSVSFEMVADPRLAATVGG